jgi:hypothetical protein
MATCRRLGLRLFGVILVLLSLYDLRVSAQAFYSFNGVEECADAAQLWYEGYWKDVRANLDGSLEPLLASQAT